MSFDAHANLAVAQVLVPPVPATTGTTLTVRPSQGARFPAAPFQATVCPPSTLPDPTNGEIVRVTNVTGDTLTIVRAQEQTLSRGILAGDVIFAGVTAKTLTDVETATIVETYRAQAAETALASSVVSEAATRATADTTNATAITAETTRATTAEAANATAITTEATTRAAADTTEAAARAAAVTTLTAAIAAAQTSAIGAAAGLAIALGGM